KADNTDMGLNGWAEGGSCLLDRKKFVQLGGFDPLYTPFYWEDIDLSYRAWKKGYKVVFDPSILVEHHHGGTTDKYIESTVKNNTAARNHYIFIWKNITDIDLLLQHVLLLPYNLIYFAVKRNRPLINGFFMALFKLPQIIKARLNGKYGLTDKEVFEVFKR